MVVVRAVPVAEVLDLRHRVLRAGLPRDTARLPGDDDPTTVALAAWVDEAGPLCTATLMVQACPWRPEVPAWRLRAMATDASARGTGLGAVVLDEAIACARDGGAELLWCHARIAARTFYERAGLATVGPPFDVPGIGPHLQMSLVL